jgi:hypothetical protein
MHKLNLDILLFLVIQINKILYSLLQIQDINKFKLLKFYPQ